MDKNNNMQIGRRSLLKITAGAAMLSGIGLPEKAFASGNGWKNVKVMEGGIMAWPYTKGK